MDWEWIDEDFLKRARVPWGWLVQAYEDVAHNMAVVGKGMEFGWDHRISITFVFDPFHRWRIK